MADLNTQVDAFILYNEHEDGVNPIVEDLETHGVSTHFWRRDVPLGENWEALESNRLASASCVLVFLGSAGWGPTHLKIANTAHDLKKRLVPILIGAPSEEAYEQVDRLFRGRRYLDMTDQGKYAENLALLVSVIAEPQKQSGSIEHIIRELVDGNEGERVNQLKEIQSSTSLDKVALGTRLRLEIVNRFSPASIIAFAKAVRDPDRIASIRSWLFSALIWADVSSDESRDLILTHLSPNSEPERNVRFWALAGLLQTKAPYLSEASAISLSDSAEEIALLARAISSQLNLDDLRHRLNASDFESQWPVLRLLRVVPIVELTFDVCRLLEESKPENPLAYDALYALSNSIMAPMAAQYFEKGQRMGQIIRQIVLVSSRSDKNGVNNFGVFLSFFTDVEEYLDGEVNDLTSGSVARQLRSAMRMRRSGEVTAQEVYMAGYASDSIDIEHDPLGIAEDVQTLTAVMLAVEVKPPLAIGLFGDWGSGKSFFMESMIAAAERIANQRNNASPKFCRHLVQIQFNAWHYVDTNLWASLVSVIFDKLADFVLKKPDDQQKKAALIADLNSTKFLVEEAKCEISHIEEKIKTARDDLHQTQKDREVKKREVSLIEFSMDDWKKLLPPEMRDKSKLALDELGFPSDIKGVTDFKKVVEDTRSVSGRIYSLFLGLLKSSDRNTVFWLILVTIFFIAFPFILKLFTTTELMPSIAAIVTQLCAALTALGVSLHKIVAKITPHLNTLEKARSDAERLLAEKRSIPTQEEQKLQTDIRQLESEERKINAQLEAAYERLASLNERIRTLSEGHNLAHFLSERVSSDDYRKHLGLLATIREDFESLTARLATPLDQENYRPVERIILYIDDLDRCPTDKVMEVLQATHLLLAFPLFVVVVGVDPRWLFHSLTSTYSVFGNNGMLGDQARRWATTPQKYLEKIFQIPFSIRPMTTNGYERLMGRLLAPDSGDDDTFKPPNSNQQPSNKSAGRGGPGLSPHLTSSPTTQRLQVQPLPKQAEVKPFKIYEEALKIKKWETDFAVELFALMPTPRAAKRFSNIYRLLKARVRHEELIKFEGTAEAPGDFQVPMLLLALLTGFPQEMTDLLPKLLTMAKNKTPINTAMKDIGDPMLSKVFLGIVSSSRFPKALDVFVKWLPHVSRFSFEVGHTLKAT